jgi:leader peptidase (prepilin peptidase)/N-methyltransferase
MDFYTLALSEMREKAVISDMVPVLSWLLLRGRCRSCSAPISARIPHRRAAQRFCMAGLRIRLRPDMVSPGFVAVSSALMIISFIDWDTSEIPDGLNLFILIIGILWNLYALIKGKAFCKET